MPHRIILSILVILSILSFAFFVWISFPPRINKQHIYLAEGMVPHDIALALEEAGIVRSNFALKVILKLRGTAGALVPGDYFFDKRQTIFKVASRITRGGFELGQKKVTIPEGSTNIQIAELIVEEFPDFDKQKFLNDAKGKQGYLFPETYHFISTSTEKIIAKLGYTFDFQVREIQSEAINENKNWNNVVIMASILEEEADTSEDFKIISGILWNRIGLDMPLQVDVATSTYLKLGFPSHPLSNPGIETLEA